MVRTVCVVTNADAGPIVTWRRRGIFISSRPAGKVIHRGSNRALSLGSTISMRDSRTNSSSGTAPLLDDTSLQLDQPTYLVHWD